MADLFQTDDLGLSAFNIAPVAAIPQTSGAGGGGIISQLLLAPLIKKLVGDPAGEQRILDQRTQLIVDMLKAGQKVKPSFTEGFDPRISALIAEEQKGPRFKGTNVEQERRLATRKALGPAFEGILQAITGPVVQTEGGETPQIPLPGQAAPPTPAGPTLGLRPATPQEQAGRLTQLQPGQQELLGLGTGQLAEQRLNRITAIAEGKLGREAERGRQAGIDRRAALEVARTFIPRGANPEQVQQIARGIQTGKMPEEVAELFGPGLFTVQQVRAAAKGLNDYSKAIGKATTDFASKTLKNADRNVKAAVIETVNAGLARHLLVLAHGNAAQAEAEFAKTARFLDDDGRALVKFEKLSTEQQAAVTADFRAIVQGTGAAPALGQEGQAILDRLLTPTPASAAEPTPQGPFVQAGPVTASPFSTTSPQQQRIEQLLTQIRPRHSLIHQAPGQPIRAQR